MSATTGSFSIGDTTVQMPVKTGTLGPSVVDISKLYAQTGMFTYDPGFTSTASCESEITYIGGEEGVLLYRGYPIEQETAIRPMARLCSTRSRVSSTERTSNSLSRISMSGIPGCSVARYTNLIG